MGRALATLGGLLAVGILIWVFALRASSYAGLSREEARRHANAAVESKGPFASGYTSFVDLRFKQLERGHHPLGREAWIASYAGSDEQSRAGAAMCVWLWREDCEVVSRVGLC
jgi:hypothetical protein